MHHVIFHRLQNGRQDLDRQIRDELRRPLPDPLRLTALKRRKLALKDQVTRVERGQDQLQA